MISSEIGGWCKKSSRHYYTFSSLDFWWVISYTFLYVLAIPNSNSSTKFIVCYTTWLCWTITAIQHSSALFISCFTCLTHTSVIRLNRRLFFWDLQHWTNWSPQLVDLRLSHCQKYYYCNKPPSPSTYWSIATYRSP